MKHIVTGIDMKKIDDYTIQHVGIPSLVLMERAALSVARTIQKNENNQKSVLIVAGTGNNGAVWQSAGCCICGDMTPVFIF